MIYLSEKSYKQKKMQDIMIEFYLNQKKNNKDSIAQHSINKFDVCKAYSWHSLHKI